MSSPQEDEMDPADESSTESRLNMPMPMPMPMLSVDDADSPDFLALKNTKYSSEESDVVDELGPPPPLRDSRIRLCKICGKDFKSDRALGGHLRIHGRQQRQQQIRTARKKSKPAKKQYSLEEEEEDEDEEEDYFCCFVCDDRFSTMKSLCAHMRKHRQQPLLPSSRKSCSLTEPKPEAEAVIKKDVPELKWSQTRKRGWQKVTVGDDKKLEEEAKDFDSRSNLLKNKKQKTEERETNIQSKIKNQEDDSSNIQTEVMGPAAADHTHKSDSDTCTVEVLGKQPELTNKIPIIVSQLLPVSKKSSNPIVLRLKRNPDCGKPAVEQQQHHQHRCEICGRTFPTGQALGGHKTYHRIKQPERKPQLQEDEWYGQSGRVIKEYDISMLLSEEAADPNPTQRSHQQLPLLDFDLNPPYLG